MIIRLFLSGSVRKEGDTRSEDNYWRSEDEEYLTDALSIYELDFLNPNDVNIDRSKSIDRFYADIKMLLDSDVVLIDARTRKGLGVGAELMMAKYENIPVLALCPDYSEYRKGDSIHAFIAGLSMRVCDSLADVADEIHRLAKDGEVPKSKQRDLPEVLR
jgi:hypothetical protein